MNWLRARPWRVYPLVRSGWRYGAIYQSCRASERYTPGIGWRASDPPGRLRALWLTLTFPHVHAADD